MVKTLFWLRYGRGFWNLLAWAFIFLTVAAALAGYIAVDLIESCRKGFWCFY